MAVLCLDCNYPLNALPVPRCPECGRAFDPRDAATFNGARPLNRLDRAVLAPVGPFTFAAAAVPCAAALYLSLDTEIYYQGAWVVLLYLTCGAVAAVVGGRLALRAVVPPASVPRPRDGRGLTLVRERRRRNERQDAKTPRRQGGTPRFKGGMNAETPRRGEERESLSVTRASRPCERRQHGRDARVTSNNSPSLLRVSASRRSFPRLLTCVCLPWRSWRLGVLAFIPPALDDNSHPPLLRASASRRSSPAF